MLNHAKRIAAFLVQPDDRIADGVQQRAVHAGADLIQENNLGIHHHGAAQFQKLFLPARNISRALIGQMADGQKLQHLIRLVANTAFLKGHRFAVEKRIHQTFTGLVFGHHHQVFPHRHGGKFMRNLKCAQQSLGEQLMRRQAGNVLAVHRHATARRWQPPGDHIEKCGFSRTIRPDQPGD